MEGTLLPEDFLGAIVNVYLPATNIKEAIAITAIYFAPCSEAFVLHEKFS